MLTAKLSLGHRFTFQRLLRCPSRSSSIPLSSLGSVSLDSADPFCCHSRVACDSKLSRTRFFSSISKTATAAPKKKKKKPGYNNVRADEGRVVLVQTTKKRKTKGPKLCSGCGTQVLFGSEVGVTGGLDAVDDNNSKSQQKKSRFVDAMDQQQYSRSSGVVESGFLCDRCLQLKSSNVWAAYDALNDVDATVFAKQLAYVVKRRQFGMCILVVDATDPEHSAMKGLRKSIGKTNCWLVLNKIDLLPRISDGDLRNLRIKIERTVGTKFTNCLAVSAAHKVGIVKLAEHLLGSLGGRDVFVVGAANVGKSTLVHSLSSCIANAVKLAGKSYQKRREIMNHLAVTGSHLPGTTLQAVRIACFKREGHALWDTPGIINKKAIQYSLFPTHLMEPLSRPLPIPLPDHFRKGHVPPGHSIIIEAGWMHKSFWEQPNAFMEQHQNKNHDLEKSAYDDYDELGADMDHVAYRRKPLNRIPFDRSVPLGPEDMLGAPTVLGRVDVIETEDPSVYLQAFLHPTLNVRIVRTQDAPDQAEIPKEFVQYIEAKMRRSISSSTSVTRPLSAHIINGQNQTGEIILTEKDCSLNSGRVFLDISFASLGWLSLAHSSANLRLIPQCVEGSVFSKRRALYPLNLAEYLEESPALEMHPDDVDSEYTKQLLRRAADVGKGNSGKSEYESPSEQGYGDTRNWVAAEGLDGDDEWY